MCFYRSREHIEFTYRINDNELNSVTSIRDLGITLTHNLNFQGHIECIVKKLFRVLCIVKRHSSVFKDLDSLKLLYCTLVRSILEYGSPIWSPYTYTSIEVIEEIQNRFLRFAVYKFNLNIHQHDFLYSALISCNNLSISCTIGHIAPFIHSNKQLLFLLL